MPHGTFLPAADSDWLYPDPAGYDTAAGPCDINQTTPTKHIPATNNTSFVAGGTYNEGGVGVNAKFTLPRLEPIIAIVNRADSPLTGVGPPPFPTSADVGDWRDREIPKASPGYARAAVKLVNGPGTTTPAAPSDPVPDASCGTRSNLFNKWIRLKGTMYSNKLSATDHTEQTTLPATAEALPPGRYEVCLSAYVQYKIWTRAGTFPSYTYSWVPTAQWRYYDTYANVDATNVTTPQTLQELTNGIWDPIDGPFQLTDCAAGAGQWT
jgi:hypothetical protein